MSALISHRMFAARAVAAGAMLLIWAAASVVVAHAQNPPTGAPAAGGCLAALVNVSDCLTYVEEGSNLTAPARACCPELAGLVERNLTCLCELLRRVDTLGVKIDASRMLGLPSACDISTPSSTLCSAAEAPLASGVSPEIEVPGAPENTSTRPENDPNHGARRTGTVLSALAMVAVALPAILLGS